MSRLRSSRGQHIAIAVLLLVILQLFAVSVSGIGARDSSVNVARDAIRREGNTVVESILRHLDPAEQSVDVTARLLSDSLIDTTSPGLERYLFTQLAVMPQMTGAFVGYPDGSFVFVSTDGDGFESKRIQAGASRSVEIRTYDRDFALIATEQDIGDTYDPTARPWYASATSAEGLSWTDPYIFFSSRQPGVTASRAVRSGDEVVAVVGVDVQLSGLSEFLDDLAVSESGEAFVTSGDAVVGAPSGYGGRSVPDGDDELRLSTTDELGLDVGDGASSGDVVRVSSADGRDLVLTLDFPSDQRLAWAVVVRAPESSFTAIVSRQQRTALLITVGGGLLILVGLLVLIRTTKPLNALQTAATTDPLTGLANRRSVAESGERLVARLSDGQRLAVMALDLDRFKSLNDRSGHHAGDEALRAVADELRDETRVADVVGRLGGDEFVVVQSVASVESGIEWAQRLLTAVNDRLRKSYAEAGLGATGGLAVGADATTDFETLLRQADDALILGKTDSKGLLRLSDSLVAGTV